MDHENTKVLDLHVSNNERIQLLNNSCTTAIRLRHGFSRKQIV